MASREDAYNESVKTLAKQAKEFLDTLETNPPDFIIHDLALVLHGTSGDVLTFSPTSETEDEIENRTLTDEDFSTLTSLIKRYNEEFKGRIDTLHTMLIERVISSALEALRSDPTDNKEVRRLTKLLSDYYENMLDT